MQPLAALTAVAGIGTGARGGVHAALELGRRLARRARE